MTDKYVMVRIIGEERVRYDQAVKMTKAEYERLNAMLESEKRSDVKRAEEIIGDCIDRRDALDSDDFELEDFMIEEPA